MGVEEYKPFDPYSNTQLMFTINQLLLPDNNNQSHQLIH